MEELKLHKIILLYKNKAILKMINVNEYDTKIVVEGYVEGWRRRGKPQKQYIDNIKQWTQLTTSQCVRAAEHRSRWKQLVSQAMVADDHTWSAEKKKNVKNFTIMKLVRQSNRLRKSLMLSCYCVVNGNTQL